MQFAPSLPPPIRVPEESGEITKLAEVNKVKDVLEQPVATPTIKQHVQHEPPPGQVETSEKRHAEGELAERRTFCRRIGRQTLLAELRSAADRRRKKQRNNDRSEHIDEEV